MDPGPTGPSEQPRSNETIYELKRYAPHEGKAQALHRRFADWTAPIFRRLGIDQVRCWTAPAVPGALY